MGSAKFERLKAAQAKFRRTPNALRLVDEEPAARRCALPRCNQVLPVPAWQVHAKRPRPHARFCCDAHRLEAWRAAHSR